MGTHSITIVRDRRLKKGRFNEPNGPSESKYVYKYFTIIYQHYDGYVEGGVGEWLAGFLCEITHDLMNKNPRTYIDAGLFGSKLVQGFFTMSDQLPRLIPFESLEEIFRNDYSYAYIVTIDAERDFNDQSIMLSVYEHENFILTARPKKFMKKYLHYQMQMKEMNKSFEEIDYGDDEVEREGYLAEDKLLIDFLRERNTYL